MFTAPNKSINTNMNTTMTDTTIYTICQEPLLDETTDQSSIWKLPVCGDRFHSQCVMELFRCNPPQNEPLTANTLKVKCPNCRDFLFEHTPYRVLTPILTIQGRDESDSEDGSSRLSTNRQHSRGLIDCQHCRWV